MVKVPTTTEESLQVADNAFPAGFPTGQLDPLFAVWLNHAAFRRGLGRPPQNPALAANEVMLDSSSNTEMWLSDRYRHLDNIKIEMEEMGWSLAFMSCE